MSVHPRIAALRERDQSKAAAGKAGKLRQRWQETVSLLLVSCLVCLGLGLVYKAKNQTKEPTLLEADQALKDKKLLNLNAVKSAGEVIPFLDPLMSEKEPVFNEADRKFAAQKLFDYVSKQRPLPNIGSLSRIHFEENEVTAAQSAQGLEFYPKRLAALQERVRSGNASSTARLSLFTSSQLEKIKPSFVIRTPTEFRYDLLLYALLYFAGFYILHIFWRWRDFDGDTLILPVIHLLTGIGFIMMVSLRDPLRDLMLFPVFVYGVAGGCLSMLWLSMRDFQHSEMRRLSFIPLIVAFALSILLLIKGGGPGSFAKVNLWGFQPVEIIKRLLVLFLAGYFAQHWEVLRELKENRTQFSAWLRKINLPRLEYAIPVLVGIALSMAFFYLQHDLGPAMVMFCMFLTLYGVARRRVGLVAIGLALLISGFVISYSLGNPQTVVTRIKMWRSPWDNTVRGGDQLARSFWAFATGGTTGTGLGLGTPGDDQGTLPAAHTDLIIASIGEELGFAGVFAVFVLYALLIHRGLRAALHAPGAYTFFVALGLTMISALQLLLITGGILGLVPLSGVVSPFLSFGRTALVANFAAFGIILAISSHSGTPEATKAFRQPVKVVASILLVLGLAVLAKAAYVQLLKSDEIIVQKPKVALAARDEFNNPKTDYLTNPRLLEIAKELPRGSIVDRNQIPLETEDFKELEAHRKEYGELGIVIDQLSPGKGGRYRPFGGRAYHLLEYLDDYDKQLRGYMDEKELIPLLRYRYRVPMESEVRQFYNRDKSVRLSIDIRLQLRLAGILEGELRKLNKQSGSIVVINPATGELLASVSYPWPVPEKQEAQNAQNSDKKKTGPSPNLDYARDGRYPPGSTFKLVTALAALKKDPSLKDRNFKCESLGNGEVGYRVGNREIHDFKGDPPHGDPVNHDLKMKKGLAQSCNAYFAQLGAEAVGAEFLFDTASQFGIEVARPNTPERLRRFLPDASFGQGEVIVSPLMMARVAGSIADDGALAPYTLVLNDLNEQKKEAKQILERRDLVNELASYMREVTTTGTAKSLKDTNIAGKTGTAEVGGDAETHAWFVGFAPYNAGARGGRIAFAVLIVNGGVGGAVATPVAREVVDAARSLNLIR